MIHEELARRAAAGTPIRVGIVGAGQFGSWLTNQIVRIPGFKLVVVADYEVKKAQGICTDAGLSRDNLVVAKSVSDVADAATRGKIAVVAEGSLIPQCPVDVVVDATGYPESGASIGYSTLMARKHLVSVNAEADCMIGAILRRTADAVGTTYNLAAGDQPADGKELFNYLKAIGLTVVAMGLGHPVEKEGRLKAAYELNSRNMIGSVDGSKNQIEMCCIANAAGLPPDVRGMHHMDGTVADLPRVFCPKADGGILSRTGVVEYARINSREQPHAVDVFAVVAADNKATMETIKEKGAFMSPNGRYAVLTRSIHLCGVESPWTIANAVITGTSSIAPEPTPVADVIAIAKRNLKVGDELDAVGGLTVRGVIERADVARRDNLLPLGLCQNVRIGRPVAEGAALTYDDLASQGTSIAWTLRRLQDTLPVA